MRYFQLPPAEVFKSGRHGLYIGKYGSYSHYNYLRGGLITRIKRGHFETALRLAAARFGGKAIDVGCADGVLLPSLAKHFQNVIGLDVRQDFVGVADDLVKSMGLSNVITLCNHGMSFQQVRETLHGSTADVAFVLETLEHIGAPGGNVYRDKIEFLNGVFSLLNQGGAVIVSVPRTVGIAFALQYTAQRLLGMAVEPMSVGEVVRSGISRNTDSLEPRWASGHVGFNDEKLSRSLRNHFIIDRERKSLTNRFFVLRRR